MACSNIPTSHIARGILGENYSLRRSSSADELCKQATMRRSYSDNHLLSSSTRLLATSSVVHNRSFVVYSNRVSTSTSTSTLPLLSDFECDNENENENEDGVKAVDEMEDRDQVKRANWVERLLELRTRWKGRKEKEVDCREDDCSGEGGCEADYGEIEDEVGFDLKTFSKLLVHVPWTDANRFSKLAYLCNKAYKISKIKAQDLQRNHGLKFVTSSLEKKAKIIALNAKLASDSTQLQEDDLEILHNQGHPVSSTVAYEIAASAACHVQNRAKIKIHTGTYGDTLYPKQYDVCPVPRGCNSEMAAQMAATTMTSVVAAKEREKQAAAKELQSLHSSPCEWFVCDEPRTRTRFFVIQGSESLASWQTNLFFEPTKFEETDALVHRGIYEAAKGIYEQFMPEIQNHLDCYGENVKFQFTGHSLGGSLSLLVHLMLMARRVVKPSAVLPVVTFGSPFVFCGGEKIIEQLELNKSVVQNVIMHRDIVPRAFSCSYPRQVEQILKRLNNSFKSHPCLNKHKLLYSPMGQVYILQPNEQVSPSHPLLPEGCALYTFSKTEPALVSTALRAFLNTPHPLEILSDRKAYGSEGTIHRDHDSKNYIKAVNGVMQQHMNIAFRKVPKERHMKWPLMAFYLEGTSTMKEVMTSA